MRFRQFFCAAVILQFGILAAVLPGPAAAEQLSAKEKAWFDTFQRGTVYARGWQDITEAILAKAPAAIKSDLERNLNDLGARIGREWSRNNDIRRIDNAMLRQWGDMLEQAAEREPERIPQVVAKLNQKVVALLD
jgi:hypothetical protein